MAKRRYPKSSENNIPEGAAYVSWDSSDPKERDKALASYSDAVSEISYASLGSRTRDFSDLTTSLSGRPGLGQSDFDWFRPGQAVPNKPKDIIAFARSAYRRIGLIRNAIDLMGDFACQGIRLVHQNPRIEKFYNVPIRMKTAKLSKSKRLEMQKSVASPDMQAVLNHKSFQKGELPWQYIFLDPLLIDPVGGSISNLVGSKLYKMQLPPSLRRSIKKLQNSPNQAERSLLQQVPDEILQASETSKGILLPPDKTFFLNYKKDDWQEWADPMTYACFKDLLLYEKLKLADQAALDGAISKIRVWKLGSLDHKLAPTSTAAASLGEILGTGTDVQRFLGEEKYKPTLMAIYACLGIPPTLTGTFGAAGTTNNFISLKTLTERLNYVRNIVIEFWNEQIKMVQEAMGFRFGAKVEFDFMYLDDPAAMTQLMINLADRNIISDELVQRNVKAQPDIERKRLKNEENKRRGGSMSEKVSPYHAVDKEFSLEKVSLQTGVVSPTQVGVKLKPKNGDESALELRQKPKESNDTKKQLDLPFEEDETKTEGPGRPKNSRDIQPREKRTFKPKRRASLELWAKQVQEAISETMNPAILAQFNKSTMRSLTSEESLQAEKIKFEILCNISQGKEVDQNSIAEAINAEPISPEIHSECNFWILEASEEIGRKLTVEETRNLRASFYVYYKENHE